METPDDEVPSDIFPAQPYYLSEMAKKPFDSSRFPKTNDRLWRRVSEAALELDPTDPNRYAWLASTAAHFGETEKELEYLGESVNHAPLNKQLRMQLADRLAATGQLEPAIEQAEICRSLDPDDPQIEASLKRLQALVSEAKHKE
jgi:tetratricopeptide (TPR) repeat protein